MLTISGAYGRDYKAKRAILADWNAGKDFIIRTFGPDDGRYVNIQDAENGGIKSFMVRYKADRQVCNLRKGKRGWSV